MTLCEIEPDVGIEVEHQPVGIFDLLDPAAPAVEFDRAHLDAGEQALDVVEIEIVLGVAVLLLDRDVLDVRAEGPGVMLLEEALPARPWGQRIRVIGRFAASTMISGSIAA